MTFSSSEEVVPSPDIGDLSRVFNIDDPIDSTIGKSKFESLANTLLDKTQPGVYNQAIMDFGATVCLPKNPACKTCPMRV